MVPMILSGFKFIRELAEFVLTSRVLIMVLIYMTVCVLPIAVGYVFDWRMYVNEKHSSTFIPEWHLFNNLLLVAHIAAAIPAIIFGPLLFIPAYRKAYPSHHRWMGTIYVFGCLFSAVIIIPLALNNAAGIEPKLGFTVMACLWFATTWFAFTSALRKDFVSHRRWMMRSYAMTFAFVHVNLTYKITGLHNILGDVTAVKVFQSMISWQANLFLVELYLAATAVNGRWLGFKKWGHNLMHLSDKDKFYGLPQRPRAAM